MLYVYYVIRWALCHTVCAHLIIYMHDDTLYICNETVERGGESHLKNSPFEVFKALFRVQNPALGEFLMPHFQVQKLIFLEFQSLHFEPRPLLF